MLTEKQAEKATTRCQPVKAVKMYPQRCRTASRGYIFAVLTTVSANLNPRERLKVASTCWLSHYV